MGKMLRYVMVLLAVLTASLSACDKSEEKVIPRAKLSRIYAEMLMTDQWISMTPDVRMIADTSLVYEPILNQFGYTTADYMHSVNVYMNDPERFSRILRHTSEILDKRLKELRRTKGQMEEARLAAIIKTNFRAEDIFPYLGEEPYVHYYDSITFVLDSLTSAYILKSVEKSDTVYDRLRMIILSDTLSVDSLKTDSLKADVGQIDTLRAKKLRIDAPEKLLPEPPGPPQPSGEVKRHVRKAPLTKKDI